MGQETSHLVMIAKGDDVDSACQKLLLYVQIEIDEHARLEFIQCTSPKCNQSHPCICERDKIHSIRLTPREDEDGNKFVISDIFLEITSEFAQEYKPKPDCP